MSEKKRLFNHVELFLKLAKLYEAKKLNEFTPGMVDIFDFIDQAVRDGQVQILDTLQNQLEVGDQGIIWALRKELLGREGK